MIHALAEVGKDLWIVKAEDRFGGTGITIRTTKQLLNYFQKESFYNRVIQKYIERPLLLGGKKFDLRFHYLILSFFW